MYIILDECGDVIQSTYDFDAAVEVGTDYMEGLMAGTRITIHRAALVAQLENDTITRVHYAYEGE